MTIYAKPNESLRTHTEKVLRVFQSVKDNHTDVTRLCGEGFWEQLFHAIFFHDVGKAAIGFQEGLKNGKAWGYRHEILSAAFTKGLECSQKNSRNIALTIMTHHKDLQTLRRKYPTSPNESYKKRYRKKLEEIEPNFNELLEYLHLHEELGRKFLGRKPERYNPPKGIQETTDAYKEFVLPYLLRQGNGLTARERIQGELARALLISCDHLASGGKYRVLNGFTEVENLFSFDDLRSTQTQAKTALGSALLTAPTGTGKTEAALLWASRNQNDPPFRRVLYVLPTRASINEMHQRLIDMFGGDAAAVEHGESLSYYYELASRKSKCSKAKETAKSLNSLARKMYSPYKITTVFQILKPFFSFPRSCQKLAELTGSLIILDEIHAYDPRITALMLEMCRILQREYNAQILGMSATIPTFIKNMFKEIIEPNHEIKFAKGELEKFTRHTPRVVGGSILDSIERIDDIKEDLKILFVCNTVLQAQEVYRELSEKYSDAALIHGKFTKGDRARIERNLEKNRLLVGTQAIEVSLNMNYDVLYTEPAPLDALIQRFGRVNRKGWEEDKLAPVYVHTSGSKYDEKIYAPDLVEETISSLEEVDILREDIIQEMMDKVYADGYRGKDEKIFEETKENFQKFVEKRDPFIEDPESKRRFHSLFDSYEVIPLKYQQKYLDLVENGNYLEASNYFTSINRNQFKRLEREGKIEPVNGTCFADVPYDSNLGLLLHEERSAIY